MLTKYLSQPSFASGIDSNFFPTANRTTDCHCHSLIVKTLKVSVSSPDWWMHHYFSASARSRFSLSRSVSAFSACLPPATSILRYSFSASS